MSYPDSYLLRHITRRGLKIHAREERDDVKATRLVNNPRTRYPLERSRLETATAGGKSGAPAISSKRSVRRRRTSSASRRSKRDASRERRGARVPIRVRLRGARTYRAAFKWNKRSRSMQSIDGLIDGDIRIRHTCKPY